MFSFIVFIVDPPKEISTSECKNYRSDCSLLADANWCEKRKSFMTKSCGPTCGFCKETDKSTNVEKQGMTYI